MPECMEANTSAAETWLSERSFCQIVPPRPPPLPLTRSPARTLHLATSDHSLLMDCANTCSPPKRESTGSLNKALLLNHKMFYFYFFFLNFTTLKFYFLLYYLTLSTSWSLINDLVLISMHNSIEDILRESKRINSYVFCLFRNYLNFMRINLKPKKESQSESYDSLI